MDSGLLEIYYKEIYRQTEFALLAYDELYSYLKKYTDEINSGKIKLYGDLINRRITHIDKFWYHVQAFFFSVGMVCDIMNNRKSDERSKLLRRNLETFSKDDIYLAPI